MKQDIKKVNKRQFQAVVVSDKSDKTVVVEIERLKIFPKYSKRIKSNRKFKCHDEKNSYHAGDQVVIEECRPYSRDKKWRVISKIKQ